MCIYVGVYAYEFKCWWRPEQDIDPLEWNYRQGQPDMGTEDGT